MMGGVSPKTCWASYKYGIINFDTLLHLVGFSVWIVLWCTDPRTSSLLSVLHTLSYLWLINFVLKLNINSICRPTLLVYVVNAYIENHSRSYTRVNAYDWKRGSAAQWDKDGRLVEDEESRKKSVNGMKTDDSASCFNACGLYSGGPQFKQSLIHFLCCCLPWHLLALYVSWHHSNMCLLSIFTITAHSTTHTTYAELVAVSLHKLQIKIHKHTKNKQRMKAAKEKEGKKKCCWCTPWCRTQNLPRCSVMQFHDTHLNVITFRP
jgi:hypothetical protein